jgi:hypothetical protein
MRAEWLAGTDPTPMLEFLRGKASDRKLRLFAVACCRRVWNFVDQRSRTAGEAAEAAVTATPHWVWTIDLPHGWEAVEAAERFADGFATPEELAAAARDAVECSHTLGEYQNWQYDDDCFYAGEVIAQSAAAASTDPVACRLVDLTAAIAFLATRGLAGPHWHPTRDKLAASAREEQAALFRDIFGNPFRPVTLDPAWLTWHDGTVPRIAQAIYDDRHLPSGRLDNTRLGILADALEDAGCTDADLLGHCRQPGVHVRGCWLVDLLLGKQ